MISRSRWLTLGLLAGLGLPLVARGQSVSESPTPDWISVGDLASDEMISKSISVPSIQSATLKIVADFARVRVEFNGTPFADLEPYCQPRTFDVTEATRLGENRIAFRPTETFDRGARVAATLSITRADGGKLSVSTDESWEVMSSGGVARPAKAQGAIPAEFWGVGRRDIGIDPFENYEQWRQAEGNDRDSPSFFVADGFEIRRLRLADADEGSWISMAFDEQGRLTIAREDQGFLRMTISDDFSTVARVQAIESDLLECRGLAYRAGKLYASANNSKRLARARIDDEGRLVEVETLREMSGGVGHGRNDFALGDDSIHLILGDSVDPQGRETLDHTSPLRAKVAREFDREGSLLRATADGRNWELLCAGLRNPYGVATSPTWGDPFTYDADNEYDLGMPWYRPTRILQLIPGADFGYREATGRIPPRYADQPDQAPPLLDIGRGSPTAVIFGAATRFPSPYREALYALDWTYGRVLAIHLAPRGASFLAAPELFLQGKPLNVTDVAIGPDGAMYLITGGRKTQSAIYRVAAIDPIDPSNHSLERGDTAPTDEISSKNRRIAAGFQSLARPLSPSAWEACRPYLEDPDPVVRYSARAALERLPADEWRQAAIEEETSTGDLRGLLAVARLMEASDTRAIVARLLSVSVADLSIDRKLVWARILGLCLQVNAAEVSTERTALASALADAWEASRVPPWQVSIEGTNFDFRRRAALLLAELASEDLPRLAAQDLLSSPEQEDRVAGLMSLRSHRVGWTPFARAGQLEALATMPRMVAGEGLPHFHAWLKGDSGQGWTAEERAAYEAREREIDTAPPLPPPRPIVRKWKSEDLRPLAMATSQGDAQRGAAVFRDALCARCHRFGPHGPWVGPDLTQVAARFGKVDLLASIIEPSKSIAENYRSVVIETRDGQIVTGRIQPGSDFRSEKVRVMPDLLYPDRIVEFDKKSIEGHQESDRSPMPEGLLDSFTLEEIADLLAYLTGARKSVETR